MPRHTLISVCIAAIALHLGWLPHHAGAALLLELDPAEAGRSETSECLDALLDSLSAAAGDSARFAACFDATRGILLLDDLGRGGELGPYPDLAALIAESDISREILIANLLGEYRRRNDLDQRICLIEKRFVTDSVTYRHVPRSSHHDFHKG